MKFKNIKISVFMVIILMYFASASSFAATSAEIKNTIKIQRMGGYVISINYETHDAWTDSLFFKVHCKFDTKEFTFTSASLNDVSRGWHKTEVMISDVTKKRYGSLREYKIELYCKGILIDTKNGY